MTEAVVLRGVRVVEPGVGVGPPTSVCLTGGRVVSVGDDAAACPAQGIELDGLWLAPGLIDLQVNGAAGHDTTEEPDSIWAVGEAIAATGVTAFLPTVITAPAGRIEDALAVIEEGPPAGYRGATPLGLHLEGPFLSPDRYGAHDPAFLRWPDPALAAGWSRAAGVAIVTLAPDLPGSLELIRTLAAKGVVVALGHSSATLEQAQAGIEAGARYATHLFNAMPPMAHREPGIAVAVLADERVTVGTIPDTIHVHPAMLDIAWRIAGPDRFSIVTDAMAALGMPHGSFRLADREVTVDDTGPRLPDGRLAGSILRLDAGVRNLAAATGRSVETALAAATTVPARLLGLADRGRLSAGARADLTILTRDFDAVGTIVGGELVWVAPQLAREVPVWA